MAASRHTRLKEGRVVAVSKPVRSQVAPGPQPGRTIFFSTAAERLAFALVMRPAAKADEQEVLERLRRNSTFLEEAIALPKTEGVEPRLVAYTRLRKTMIAAQRAAVLQARREGRYQEPAIISVLAAIDAEETALRLASPRKKAPVKVPRAARTRQ